MLPELTLPRCMAAKVACAWLARVPNKTMMSTTVSEIELDLSMCRRYIWSDKDCNS